MKRYIHSRETKDYSKFITSSKYVQGKDDELLFDDVIRVDIEVKIPSNLGVSDENDTLQIVKFPGIEQFKKDVLDILENEYHFDVIEDTYEGVKSKGHISNRADSISLYFDTYFDLCYAGDAIRRVGVYYEEEKSGKVYCFIHLRFSDHDLADFGDALHRKFISDNAAKYTSNRSDVTHIMKEEQIILSEREVNYYYNQAIDDLRTQLDLKILYWVKKLDLYKRNR